MSEQSREIKLCDKSVGYTLKTSKKAKKIRLSIHCDGSFVATRPAGLSENIVEKFIIQKTAWVLSKLEYFKQFKGSISGSNRGDYLKHKDEALKLANERINYFNKIYNFRFSKISVRNQKTRWGSCSRKRNLNFNYKILSLPKYISDYVIVHELCHLKEFNHSRNFWNLVAKAIPDYLDIRKELKHKRLNYY